MHDDDFDVDQLRDWVEDNGGDAEERTMTMEEFHSTRPISRAEANARRAEGTAREWLGIGGIEFDHDRVTAHHGQFAHREVPQLTDQDRTNLAELRADLDRIQNDNAARILAGEAGTIRGAGLGDPVGVDEAEAIAAAVDDEDENPEEPEDDGPVLRNAEGFITGLGTQAGTMFINTGGATGAWVNPGVTTRDAGHYTLRGNIDSSYFRDAPSRPQGFWNANQAEAVMAFAAWLSFLDTTVSFSKDMNPALRTALVSKFLEHNGTDIGAIRYNFRDTISLPPTEWEALEIDDFLLEPRTGMDMLMGDPEENENELNDNLRENTITVEDLERVIRERGIN